MLPPRARTWALAALLAVSACTYEGGNIAEPTQRNAQWFSFVGGDDLRAECAPGRAPRYRFVYNATWQEQVRVYELDRLQPGEGGLLRVRVFRGGSRILQFWLLEWASSATQTTFVGDVRLSEEQYLAIIRATEASGFGEAAPVGLRLPSWDFYWVVNACADGLWHLNAWRQPGARWTAIRFDELLFAADPIGVAVRRPPTWPRSWTEGDFRVSQGSSMSSPDSRGTDGFQLQVGRDGLSGNLRVF
jgi:hypothetical protein